MNDCEHTYCCQTCPESAGLSCCAKTAEKPAVNGEYVCELIRAHYDGDNDRFTVIASQLAVSEALHGSTEVARRIGKLLRGRK
jgi:hypothetical protein